MIHECTIKTYISFRRRRILKDHQALPKIKKKIYISLGAKLKFTRDQIRSDASECEFTRDQIRSDASVCEFTRDSIKSDASECEFCFHGIDDIFIISLSSTILTSSCDLQ